MSLPSAQEIELLLPPGRPTTSWPATKPCWPPPACAPGQADFVHLRKRSVDARGRSPLVRLRADIYRQAPPADLFGPWFSYPDVSQATRTVLIVGAGPAGLFAALRAIELGIRPDCAGARQGRAHPPPRPGRPQQGAPRQPRLQLLLRRRRRRHLLRRQALHPRHQARRRAAASCACWCSTAPPPTFWSTPTPTSAPTSCPPWWPPCATRCARPAARCASIRGWMIWCSTDNRLHGVVTAAGEELTADAVILATGHSARDIYELLHRRGVLIEAKPFALGVRVEHPQQLIDQAQYRRPDRGPAAGRVLLAGAPDAGGRASSGACFRSACARAASSCRPPRPPARWS